VGVGVGAGVGVGLGFGVGVSDGLGLGDGVVLGVGFGVGLGDGVVPPPQAAPLTVQFAGDPGPAPSRPKLTDPFAATDPFQDVFVKV
jgi:hypothetical protein